MPADSVAGKCVCKTNRELGCPPAERFQSLVLSENEEGGGHGVLGREKLPKNITQNKASNKQPCQGGARSGCEPLQVQGCLAPGPFPPMEGKASCRARQATTVPLLRSRRLISPDLNESVWRNC